MGVAAEVRHKAALPVAETLFAVDAFRWCLRLLDAYGRWDSAMSISRHLPEFFSSLLFAPLTLLVGFIIIGIYVQRRTASQEGAQRLYDSKDQPIPRLGYDWKWLWVTGLVLFGSCLAAALYAGGWLMNYSPELPKIANAAPEPPPQGYEKPAGAAPKRALPVSPQAPVTINSAPGGFATSGGTLINPTVNNNSGLFPPPGITPIITICESHSGPTGGVYTTTLNIKTNSAISEAGWMFEFDGPVIHESVTGVGRASFMSSEIHVTTEESYRLHITHPENIIGVRLTSVGGMFSQRPWGPDMPVTVAVTSAEQVHLLQTSGRSLGKFLKESFLFDCN